MNSLAACSWAGCFLFFLFLVDVLQQFAQLFNGCRISFFVGSQNHGLNAQSFERVEIVLAQAGWYAEEGRETYCLAYRLIIQGFLDGQGAQLLADTKSSTTAEMPSNAARLR